MKRLHILLVLIACLAPPAAIWTVRYFTADVGPLARLEAQIRAGATANSASVAMLEQIAPGAQRAMISEATAHGYALACILQGDDTIRPAVILHRETGSSVILEAASDLPRSALAENYCNSVFSS